MANLDSYLAARKAGAAALKEKMDRASDAGVAKRGGMKKAVGTGLGAAAGAVGAYMTGNPALISMGAQLGGELSGVAMTEAEKEAMARTGSGDEAAKALGNLASMGSKVGGMANMMGQYDFSKMSDKDIAAALQKNPGLFNTDKFQAYLQTRDVPLPAFPS